MNLEAFDFNNINQVVNRVTDCWGLQNAPQNIRRLYAEAVVRLDMHDNKMQFQLTNPMLPSQKASLMAIACSSTKNEKPNADIWWNKIFPMLNSRQQQAFSTCRNYLAMMDQKVYSLMTQTDVKLDLFISTAPGWGKKLLNPVFDFYRQQGFKTVYLWTDCECNVDWYFKNNYQLVNKESYEPFSHNGQEYWTYIFKKALY